MGTPHKHAELIKAWADGAEIQYYSNLCNEWRDTTYNQPTWSNLDVYRIKPKTIRYRLYLNINHKVCAVYNDEDIVSWFIKWLTDWQEVEI